MKPLEPTKYNFHIDLEKGKRTKFDEMRLWIIQDEDYSELKKVPGCEDFCNLPATKRDAE